tara:strand:+ start:628 stop:819 length:192 start_codon:yes stop_codon:yes gene_type:complete
MAKFTDRFVETTDPKYARKISARFVKIYGKGRYKLKTLGKVQRAGTTGGFGKPDYLVRIRRVK